MPSRQGGENYSSLLRFYLAWILAGVLEYPFFASLKTDALPQINESPLYPFFLHGLAVFVLFLSAPRGKGWFHPQRVGPRTYSLFALFFPGIGWLVAGMIAFLNFYSFGDKKLFDLDEPMDKLAPFMEWENPKIAGALVLRKERIFSELNFMPLVDIIAGDQDADLKRGAIDKLSRFKTPEAIDILLSLRGHAEAEIRFYATSSLSRIKKEFDEQLEASKQEMKKDVYKISARIFLAKVYIQYARSHLLDPVTSEAYEHEALYHLNYCAETEYVTDEDFWLMVEIHKGHREWDKALAVLEILEKRGGVLPEEIIKNRIETAYQMKRYDLLHPLMEKLKALNIADSDWTALIHWWGEFKRAPQAG